MKTFKKLLCTVLSVIAVFGFAALAACGEPSEPEKTYSVSFKETSVTMVIGESKKLGYEATEKEDETPVFTSSNEAVLTVNEKTAEITAVKCGSATVTASFAGKTATCAVTVTDGGFVPALGFEGVADNLTKWVGDTVDLTPYVTFNEAKFYDCSVSYDFSAEGVVKVENDVLTALKKGTVTVTATANWRDLSNELLVKEFTVTVSDKVEVYFNDGKSAEVSIYTLSSFNGETYATTAAAQLNVLVNGAAAPADKISVTVVSGEDCVTLAGGVVTGVKGGTAVIKGTYNGDDGEISTSMTVKVLRPVIEKDTDLGLFDATDGIIAEASLTSLFTVSGVTVDANVVAAAYSEGGALTALTVENGKISGFNVGREMTSRRVTLYNDTYGVEFSLTPVTKILKRAADLAVLNVDASDKVIDGYFYVANDLTDDPSFCNEHTDKKTKVDENAGFKGVFDGNGKAISYTAYANGLFGNLLQGATVKNAAFVNLTLKSVSNGARALGLCYLVAKDVTLEDLYFEVEDFNSANNGNTTAVIANEVKSAAKFKNIVINVTAPFDNYEFTDNMRTDHKLLGFYGYVCVWVNTLSGAQNLYAVTGSKMPASGAFSSSAESTHQISVAANDAASLGETLPAYPTVRTVEGHYRYNTYAELLASDNDFAAFTASVWKAGLNLPVWAGADVGEYVAVKADDANVTDTITVGINGSKTITANLGKVNVPVTIEVIGGNTDRITVSGTVISASNYGFAKIKLSYTVAGKNCEKTLNVLCLDETSVPVTVTNEIWLSALDGTLFTTNGEVADLTGGAAIVAAQSEAGNIVVESGKLTGINVNNNNFIQTSVTLFDQNGKVTVLTNVKVYTKVLTKASDLAVFNLTSAVSTKGYYIVAKDLTDDPTFTNLHPGYANSARFNGIFDGNGHTVTFTVSAHGLFGNTDWSAVIKNVAFKNLTTAAAKDHGDQVILCNLPYGAFEDVYISFADFDSVNRGHRTALFSNPSGNTVKMTRVIIDIPDASVDAVDYESGTKSYYGPISLYGTAAKDFTVTGSVYVIAKFMPMISCGFSGKAYYMYAVNDYKEGESASTTHKVLNSYRYDTVADMKADTTNYDATGFTASVWQNVNI
ncbi:MAG TPA: hypothetical protein DEV87_00925 [Clostridiales bacterium]|nr:hypothetical protein [Clostridiales bacterium]